MQLLITGFEPFQGSPLNPSTEAARALAAQSPEGVLYQVMHDPAGRKELCGSGDVLRSELALAAIDLGFLFLVEELIDPAYRFISLPSFGLVRLIEHPQQFV